MQKKRVGVRLFKAVIVSLLLLCVIGVAGAGVFAYQIIQNTPEVTAEDIMPQGYTSFIVDQNGNQIERLNDSSSNRVYRTYDQIPEYMAHAFVAIEDERFYEHNGIDLQGIIRAGVIGITNGFNFTEGASTLTQQLIKNNVFPDFVNEETLFDRVERKLQEQYLALQIEKDLSKEEILEAYMNTINLGQGCLGVQAASTRYFNKNVSDLTLSECAVIAAITQNPTRYDPVKNPDDNAERRQRVLDNMLEQGYISQQEYDEAVADNVYDRILETAAATTNDEPYSYFVDALIEQLVNDLMTEKGYSEAQAYNLIYSGGLTITATQDSEIQKICDEEVADVGDYLSVTEYGLEYALTIHREDGTAENYSQEQLASYIRDKYDDDYPLVFSSEDAANEMIAEYKSTLNIGENDTVDENINLTLQPQVSVVLMDQYTGQVKAIVGGRGEKKTSLSLNRATGSTRQPGSCFKILSTYAPALNECGMNLSSPIVDEYYEYKTGQEVRNWDLTHVGTTNMRYAIEHSINVCAVRTLTEVVGEEKGFEYLENFGITTLTDEDRTSQAKALGGITNGVYNIELTAAYAAIANGGTYTEPILYTQVLDHDGNVLLDNSTPDTHEVIKESTAYLLTNAMEDVINQGTGTSARLDNMHAAGKTGTTNSSTDLWLAAYTPYYTASVWGGYDSNKPMENLSQSWHSRLWKAIMDKVHEGLEDKEFEVPSSVVEASICSETGLLAVSSCPSYTDYFAEENVPTQSCSGHYVEPEPEEEAVEETPEEGTTEEVPAEGATDPNGGTVETPSTEQPVTPETPAEPPVEETPPAETPTDPAAPAQ
ncbi:MAG TPA: transglycosylase domain-containing protein [Candidatus Mediterraneibacter intestinavium]|nr:transglycosylase domain-containing protein [Candidatus Mediterraneibacter intestinavium]